MFAKKSIFRMCAVLLVAANLFGGISPTLAAPPSSPSASVINPAPPAQTVKLIFIHHSTGENLLSDDYGGLGKALKANNYFVSDTNYGWGPNAIGDRTDIPDWTEWFRSGQTATYMNALFKESGQNSSYKRLPTNPGGENEIILFKSCFPNSNLEGNPNDPPDPNGWMTVGHAKYVYNEILKYFKAHPDKLFVVITAPPVTDSTYAANARAFNNWLFNDWLASNHYSFSNVAVFDFYNVLTAPNAHHRYNASTGSIKHISTSRNTLYYPSGDDHPSIAGSKKAVAEFLPLLNIFYNRWKADDIPQTAPFSSTAAQDGWILETAENGNAGGTLDNAASILDVGDDAANRQYRGFLSFNTASLQDTAVITKVTLRILKQGWMGTNPFTTHGKLLVDIRKPYFGAAVGLALDDFIAMSGKSAGATFGSTPVNNWYSAIIGSAGYVHINKTGVTQFRLHFAMDDNNDHGADFMRFYSGNAGAAYRPQLIIKYYIP